MNMKPGNEFAGQLVDALENGGIEWREYSGRGMFGAYCVAVDCGSDVTEGEVLYTVRNVTAALNITRDSMGKGTVVYWPRAKLVDEAEKSAG